MKKSYFKSIYPAALIVLGTGFLAINGFNTNEKSVYQPRKNVDANRLAEGHAQLFEMYHRNHATGVVDPADFERAWTAIKPIIMDGNRAVGMEWSEEGPDNVGGRTRAILVNRNNSAIVFAGSVTGGLYKSSDRGGWWTRVTSFDDVLLSSPTGTSLAISSMCQAYNGRIYVGTGCDFENAGVLSGQMQYNNGIYYTDDLGATWTHLVTTPSLNVININELQADPTQSDRIWIGANKLYTYDPTAGLVTKYNAAVKDVKVSPDGMVVVMNGGSNCYVSTDYGSTFTSVSGSGATQIGTSNMRVEFGISFEKNALNNWSIFAHCSKTSGLTEGYISNDNGVTWAKTLPANGLINPVGTQGMYGNVCGGVLGRPDRFYTGGIDTYLWTANPDDINTGTIEQKSLWFLDAPNPVYVHADNHEIEWDHDAGQAYLGNDGGISKTIDNTMSFFYTSNRGYNVTQFYSVAFSGRGDVLGGCQDNGTNYNDHSHSFYQSFVEVKGGDGFDCDISQINPSYMFASVYYGDMQRSNNYGASFSGFYNNRLQNKFGTPGDLTDGLGPFHTVGRLFENENDNNSTDTMTIKNSSGDTIFNGTTTTLYFTHRNYSLLDSLTFTATQDYLPGDSITCKVDKVQSLYAIGVYGGSGTPSPTSPNERGVWITRGACDFAASPIWDSIPGITTYISSTESVIAIEFSADGNHMFVSTSGGDLIRVSGLNSYYGGTGGRDLSGVTYERISVYSSTIITGIICDPNNANHVIVTLAGYGASNIYEITNATTAPFSSTTLGTDISGALPSMPVYDGVIDVGDATGNTIIIGTEYGVYTTDNGGITWTYESGGIGGGMGPGPVPVTAVRQQIRPWSNYSKNPGVIYIGTLGRGIWKSETLLSIGNDPMDESKTKPSLLNLTVYPNPVSDFANLEFTLAKDVDDIKLNVYALNGKLVATQNINKGVKGKNQTTLNVSEFAKGTYLVAVFAGNGKFTAKMVVR